jgi:trimeric autotransporter adhesin
MPEDARETTAKIARLRGVTWEWREEAPPEAKAQPGMGVIAQELEKVFPELVITDEQGLKSVVYEGLIAPLIEAVKELDVRVSVLESELAAVRAERAHPQSRGGG